MGIWSPCTASVGILSLQEIEAIIKEKGLIPELIPDAMIKQITWDDQWIGYDDNETIALKTAWADSLCLGGTQIWSVDLNPASGRLVSVKKQLWCQRRK
jgi:chitinase